MRTFRPLLVGMAAVMLLAVSGVGVAAQSGDAPVVTAQAQPLLARCFETPGVQPLIGNRPGYTYRSFTSLRSGCGEFVQACEDADSCIAWTCFHPTYFGQGGVLPGLRPVACHLKSEVPIPSPDPCAPAPLAPTSGNGVRDDRCYTSSQAPMTLPPRPEREDGVQSTISIADPALAQSIGEELIVEQGLLNQVAAAQAASTLGDLFLVLSECGDAGVWPASPGTAALEPGLVTGTDARDAFEVLRRNGQVAFLDFEETPTGVHDALELGGAAGDFAVNLRTTELRYPLPPRAAPAGLPVVVLPYSFVTSPPNHRLMGVVEGEIPDGQSRYELVLSPPASHVGLLRMWNTNSLTRFFDEAGALLAAHRNTTNHEFVGYVADGPDDLVSRIEFDGVPSEPDSTSNKIYQVGEVDDLYVGNVGEP